MSKSGVFSEERHGHAGAGSEQATKMLKGLEHLSYERALRQSVLKGDTCEKDGNRFFSRACCNRTRGYGFKLK